MKLIDFSEFEPLNDLIKKMGAKLVQWNISNNWKKFNEKEFLDRLNTPEGIEIGFNDLTICDDGTFDYKGRKVLLYIRDQIYNPFYPDARRQYKYHICDCQTLKTFRRNNRFSRYVVSNNTDGKLLINLIHNNEVYDEVVEELGICRFCLHKLRYRGYSSSKPKYIRDEIYNEFDLKQFFKKYGGTLIRHTPPHTADTAPLNVYSDDNEEIAKRLKESKYWKCEKCGIDLSNDHKFLHMHHKDGNKSNNNLSNLEVLCTGCHANVPGHNMKNTGSYRRFITRYGDRTDLFH